MNKMISFTPPGTTIDPRYPDSNGRFMGETDFHNVAMMLLREGVEDHFAERSDVYVASNLVFYWMEGDARRRRDPDVLVARGVMGKHKRRSYRLWEEKVLPCTLFEISSRRSWRVDLRQKPALYASIGIKEYFLFDPEDRYLKPNLQGFRGVKGEAVAMKPAEDGSLVSKQLGLILKPEGDMLRLIDARTGHPVLTRAERADLEKQLREQEHMRADRLEAEVQRLRQLLNGRSQ